MARIQPTITTRFTHAAAGERPKTRFAPSPTGHLHLGHVAHMIWVWGISQLANAEVHLRLEDHDRSRCNPEYTASILRALEWLNLPLDSGHLPHLWLQSARQNRYEEAFQKLQAQGMVYACNCSRKEIALATGTQEGELTYPGTCRAKKIPLSAQGTCIRIIMPDTEYEVRDPLHGITSQNPAKQCGDIVIKDRQGSWTYQFCVVIDDLDQKIDLIVRGSDLLSSAGRQLALRNRLAENQNPPTLYFLHHPLILNESGEKLSKRTFAEGIQNLRDQGKSATEVFGLAAYAAKLQPSPEKLEPKNFANVLPQEVRNLFIK